MSYYALPPAAFLNPSVVTPQPQNNYPKIKPLRHPEDGYKEMGLHRKGYVDYSNPTINRPSPEKDHTFGPPVFRTLNLIANDVLAAFQVTNEPYDKMVSVTICDPRISSTQELNDADISMREYLLLNHQPDSTQINTFRIQIASLKGAYQPFIISERQLIEEIKKKAQQEAVNLFGPANFHPALLSTKH